MESHFSFPIFRTFDLIICKKSCVSLKLCSKSAYNLSLSLCISALNIEHNSVIKCCKYSGTLQVEKRHLYCVLRLIGKLTHSCFSPKFFTASRRFKTAASKLWRVSSSAAICGRFKAFRFRLHASNAILVKVDLKCNKMSIN